MLYVFLVDTGTMWNFDMNLAVESVSHLQEAIADECQIPVDKQVLLISGGENLDPGMRVCSYHAGTDTNPIYVFSKSTIESAAPPSPSVYGGSDGDLKYQVEGSLNMNPSYETVITRVQLALQIYDLAKDEVTCCESLVHDQHLQQQGWAAVVANLEDISSAFGQRSSIFQLNFDEFLTTRSQYLTMLRDFGNVLSLLSKMPLLPCLLSHQNKAKDLSHSLTLLQWISSQDQRSTLQQMAEQCIKALEQFDESVLNNLMTEINTSLEGVDNVSMKEIKGLGDRLYGLEQLMAGARKIVQEQGDMSQGFVQNQERVHKLNDPSILPDLCNSHQKQLMVMLKNHSQLRDIRRRCTLAKEELSINLHARLRWIMYVEKQISDIDSKMVIYHENLKRLRRRLEIVEQIHMAPKLYVMAVVEVYRRRLFSTKFMEWASKLTEDAGQIQGEEVSRRMEFSAVMGKHFLHALFPGLDDYPSSFATEIPDSFDTGLPEITVTDITELKDYVPELATLLRVPDVDNCKKEFEEHHQEVLALKSLTLRSPLKELPEGGEKSLIGNMTPTPGDKTPTIGDIALTQGDKQPAKGDNACNLNDTVPTLGDIVPSKPNIAPRDVATSTEQTTNQDIVKVTEDASKDVVKDTERVDDNDEMKRLSLSFEKVALDEEFQKMAEEHRQSLKKIDETVQGAAGQRTANNVPLETMPFLSFADQNEEFLSASQSLLPDVTDGRKTDISTGNAELKSTLIQKTIELVKVQHELQISKMNLVKEKEKCQKLCQVLNESKATMKVDVQDMKELIETTKTDFSVIVENTNIKFVQAVENVKKEYKKDKSDAQSLINQLKQNTTEMEATYKKKLQEEVDKCNSVQQQNKTLKEQLKSTVDNSDSVQRNYESQMKELQSKLEREKDKAVESLRNDMIQHIRELEIDIKAKEKVIAELALEKDQLAKDLRSQFENAKRELEANLKVEADRKEQRRIEEVETKLNSEHKEKMESMKKEFEENVKKLSESSQREKEELRERIELKYSENITELTEKLQHERECEIEEIKERLLKEHQSELNSLQAKYEAEKNDYTVQVQSKLDEQMMGSKMEESFQTDKQSAILAATETERRKYEERLQKLQAEFLDEREQAIAAAVEMERQKHQIEMDDMVRSYEKDKHDSLTSMRTSLQAEKQVSFNEALTKVTLEKVKIITSLEQKQEELKLQQQKDQETIAKLLSGHADITEETNKALTQAQDTEKQLRQNSEDLENKLEQAERKLEVLEGRVPLQRERPLSMTFDKIPEGSLSASAHSDITQTSLESQDRIHMLDVALRAKEEECKTLNQRLLQLTRATSARADKVSIQNFSIGDIVLICFDEYRENYVIFTIGPILYFVHSDSVTALDLKPQPGRDRKLWVLGQITDKEYCQAKKAQNRFKVPPGTKFYRVKAVPWPKKT